MENILTAVTNEYSGFLRKKRGLISFITCCIMFGISLLFAFQTGYHFMRLVANHLIGISLFFICLFEYTAIGLLYGNLSMSLVLKYIHILSIDY